LKQTLKLHQQFDCFVSAKYNDIGKHCEQKLSHIYM
jgi:hypothetical protein